MKSPLPFLPVLSLLAVPVLAAQIVIEAESAVEIEAPMEKGTTPAGAIVEKAASGGAYLFIKEGAGNPPKLDKGFAKYEFEVRKAGAYRLWARVRWEGECSNSFMVQIDDRPAFLFGEDATFNVWHWVRYPVARMAPLLKLSKGKHTLVFRNREDGVSLDQILLTTDKRTVPVGILPGAK